MAKQSNLFGDIDDLQATVHIEATNLEEELKTCRKRMVNLRARIEELEKRVDNMKDAEKKVAKLRTEVEKASTKKKT